MIVCICKAVREGIEESTARAITALGECRISALALVFPGTIVGSTRGNMSIDACSPTMGATYYKATNKFDTKQCLLIQQHNNVRASIVQYLQY